MLRTRGAGDPSAVDRQEMSMSGQTAPAHLAEMPSSPFDTRAATAESATSGVMSVTGVKAAPMRSAGTPGALAAARALALNGAISKPAMISAMPTRIAAATILRDWII